MAKNTNEIAQDYITAWEDAWNTQGVEATTELYASDSVLVGYVLAVGKTEIKSLLDGIFAQGWTKIKIRVTNVREVNGVILVANEYTAFGSGANDGRTLDAKSSHVLVKTDSGYVSVLHTAT